MSLLDATKKKIEKSVPEQYKKTFYAIVTNGMKLMWSEQTHQNMKAYIQSSIQNAEDVPFAVAQGIRGVIRIVLEASPAKKDDPNDPFYAASYPAALVLMCDALEYIEKAKQVPVNEQVIADSTKAVVAELNNFYGIHKEQLQSTMGAARQKVEGGQGLLNQAPAPEAAPVQDEVPLNG